MKRNYQENPYLGVHTPRTMAESERGADYGGVIYHYKDNPRTYWGECLFLLAVMAGILFLDVEQLMSWDNRKIETLKEALESWDGFDPYLSYMENFIEMKLQMGMLDDAGQLIARIKEHE